MTVENQRVAISSMNNLLDFSGKKIALETKKLNDLFEAILKAHPFKLNEYAEKLELFVDEYLSEVEALKRNNLSKEFESLSHLKQVLLMIIKKNLTAVFSKDESEKINFLFEKILPEVKKLLEKEFLFEKRALHGRVPFWELLKKDFGKVFDLQKKIFSVQRFASLENITYSKLLQAVDRFNPEFSTKKQVENISFLLMDFLKELESELHFEKDLEHISAVEEAILSEHIKELRRLRHRKIIQVIDRLEKELVFELDKDSQFLKSLKKTNYLISETVVAVSKKLRTKMLPFVIVAVISIFSGVAKSQVSWDDAISFFQTHPKIALKAQFNRELNVGEKRKAVEWFAEHYKSSKPFAYKYLKQYLHPEMLKHTQMKTWYGDKGTARAGVKYHVYDATQDFIDSGFNVHFLVKRAAMSAKHKQEILDLYNQGKEVLIYYNDKSYWSSAAGLEFEAMGFFGFYAQKMGDGKVRIYVKDLYDWFTTASKGTNWQLTGSPEKLMGLGTDYADGSKGISTLKSGSGFIADNTVFVDIGVPFIISASFDFSEAEFLQLFTDALNSGWISD
ncbi:MAG: hypothetical protein ABIC91_04905 [Nanoarchaeota archaeon]|nr:hypothetical protein [Nanoarchaeota archaeon]MBU1031144.1 hypothetical protein [Nanoarchaeota archaeon]